MMTFEEKMKLNDIARQLEKEGKLEEAFNISMKIPLAPYLAKAAKEVYGVEYIKNSGFDLSEAEAEYGKDWLTK